MTSNNRSVTRKLSADNSEVKNCLESSLINNYEIILGRLEQVIKRLESIINNKTDKAKNNDPFQDVKLTTIAGPQAARMLESLKRGEAFSYRDNSVEGVPILDIYITVDSGYWFDVWKQVKGEGEED